MESGGQTHLYAYHPQELPFTRITAGPWDDIHPAICPDGLHVAFTSNRNGYWDLYVMDLSTGSLLRLTDTLEYDAAPSWSPDGRWIVYETYKGAVQGGLELFIRPIEGDQDPIRLTEHPGADHSAAWSPLGRQIAFVSNRNGTSEIWLADLDKVGEERFINLSKKPEGPGFSPRLVTRRKTAGLGGG
jgi:TolB protein